MKVYLVTFLQLDFDGLGGDGIKDVIESVHYPNHCLSPDVLEVREADIGEWDDSHPLNHTATRQASIERLFPRPTTTRGPDAQ